jgi:hypothetical protein
VIELDPTDTVPGPAKDTDVNGTFDRALFKFLEGDLNGLDNVDASDLGPAGASSTTQVNGGLLVVLSKIVDATRPTLSGGNTANIGDADGFDRSVFAYALLPAGTAVLQRVQIDNNFNEDVTTGAVGALKTGVDVLRIIPVDPSTNLTTTGTGLTTGSYGAPSNDVIFTEPREAEGAGSDGLYTRKFDGVGAFAAGTSTGAAADFDAAFEPDVGASFELPIRLDHLTGGDVESVFAILVNNTTAAIAFREDAHNWFQVSSDGVSWLTENGAPNPALMDNDTSANVTTQDVEFCHDDECDVDSFIYFFRKNDVDGDQRLRIRVGQ